MRTSQKERRAHHSSLAHAHISLPCAHMSLGEKRARAFSSALCCGALECRLPLREAQRWKRGLRCD
eukprot:6175761-Pleurochrysis_carterae.AAC.1